jgi:hypothetical protein
MTAIHQLCDAQDSCKVDLECCLKYMEIPNKQELFQEVNDFCNLFMKLTENV